MQIYQLIIYYFNNKVFVLLCRLISKKLVISVSLLAKKINNLQEKTIKIKRLSLKKNKNDLIPLFLINTLNT